MRCPWSWASKVDLRRADLGIGWRVPKQGNVMDRGWEEGRGVAGGAPPVYSLAVSPPMLLQVGCRLWQSYCR